MKRRAALSTHSEAQDAAEEALTEGGSALHAVITGFLFAAGLSPSPLLGPVGLLYGGVGHGAKAFDGRARQPGLDARRPRGFTNDEPPKEAYAAAPGSLAALTVALSYLGGKSLLACGRPGIQAAKRSGAAERARFMETALGAGGLGLKQPAIQRAFLAAAGPTAGGNLSAADLEMRFAPEHPARVSETLSTLPWAVSESSLSLPDGLRRHSIIAIDATGLLAALCFFEGPGVPVREFEIELPALASPVLRGVPRAKPGTPIDTPMELTLEEGDEGGWDRVAARGSAADVRIALSQDRRTRAVRVSSAFDERGLPPV